jgi:hypothetical protein
MFRLLVSAILSIVVLSGAAAAQEKPAQDGKATADKADNAARAAAVASFLDDQTVVVARLDASRLDLEGASRQLKRLLGGVLGDELDKATMAGEMAKGGFTAVGGREAYLIVSLADVPSRAPFGIIPVSKGTDTATLARSLRPLVAAGGGGSPPGTPPTPAEALQRSLALVCEPLAGAVFVGPVATLERLRKADGRPPIKADELARAFTAAGDGTAQAVLLISDDQRRVIDEMFPNLPPALGGGSTKPFSQGLRFAALGVDVSAKLSIRVAIQAQDAAAAEAQSAVIAKGLDLFAASPQVKKQLPAADKIAKALAPRVMGDQVVIQLSEANKGLTGLISGLAPAVATARTAADRAITANNLKQIGLGLHSYHDTTGSFPARANFDAAGKPLLSWRVQMLPYLDQSELYKEFRQDEPWDSEHNKKLLARMPEVFRAPGSKNKADSGKTNFLAPIWEGSVLGADKGTKIADIRDGTSNTIAVVEVSDEAAVPWTKPDDWQVDDKDPIKGLSETFAALLCDGSVRFFTKDITPDTLKALLTRSGGEVVSP